jgi:diguanylate cyclase (GGDEF)-like protein
MRPLAFGIDSSEPEVVLAQLQELRRQVPLLYALLTVNAVAVAYTHHGFAPFYLTVIIPSILILLCLGRFVVWLAFKNVTVSPEAAVGKLRKTIVLSAILAAAYVAWALSLARYGGPYEQGHVALFIAITVIGCIFCLLHLPQAALVVTVIVTLPYLVYYLSSGSSVFVAVALNIALVTAVMLQVLLNSFGSFASAVRSQKALQLTNLETERLSAENLRLAHTDHLTSLPNRRYFFSRLQTDLSKSEATQRRLTIGVMDLDRFKAVNDTHGHVIGDRLLTEVGARLAELAGETVLVARLGGDEFGFIATGSDDMALSFGQRACEKLAEPFSVGDLSLSIGSSCGIAIYPDAAKNAEELFDCADYALYTSKAAGQGRAVMYSDDHENEILSERAVEAALRSADLDRELDVHFQQIVDTQQGRIIAVEALARWTSPVLGKVRPDRFIPVAERTGLIHQLTLKLFQKALCSMEKMPDDLRLSFNLSTHDLTSPQTVVALIALLNGNRISPERLTFEITETAVLRDYEAAERSIALFKQMGIRIALDDFGTGQSSLSYLHRLKINKIKIDRSFVEGLRDPEGVKIVASILGLCRNLELDCVAEGVEDERQLALLQQLGCTKFQGYYWGTPADADTIGAEVIMAASTCLPVGLASQT